MVEFSTEQYKRALESIGRRVRRSGKNLITNCLGHRERNPSMEVFPDGWCQCFAGCGRFHISHYFDELKDTDWKPDKYQNKSPIMAKPIAEVAHEEKPEEYEKFDLFDLWGTLPPIARGDVFKKIPLEVLDELGWRWTDGCHGMASGYFIPYFNHTKDSVPFAQVRHLTGERRFTMLPRAEACVYGKWNISPGERLFVVEGCSDAAVLEYAMIPWVAMPSASSGPLLKKLAAVCLKNDIGLIYAGDNDDAGNKLRDVLDEICPYRTKQPPKDYKDWGDFLQDTDIQTVSDYCWEELREPDIPPMVALGKDVFGAEPHKQSSMW